MAVTAVGFDGTINETQFARLMRAHGEVGYKHGVLTGLNTTAAAGTRQVSVSLGTAVLPGLLVDSSSAATVAFNANSSGSSRADYLVLRADWTTNTVIIAVVQGASSVPPALTQTEGGVWEMPLALVTIRNGVTTLLSTDVVVCKPLPRNVQYGTDDLVPVSRAAGAVDFTVGTVTFPDPGWPYRLKIAACGRFTGGSTYNGYANMYVFVDGVSFTHGQSMLLSNPGTQSVMADHTTDTKTGPTTIQVKIGATAMVNPSTLDLITSDINHFRVLQIPA